ncbi:related to alpha/beta hydrolase [Ramularia collo-cygni]|uniref:Related to alpha/beta hydrolase n=1 Tax=Ramularia collo-cygni TaxID=112498 RepID=A0A2D3UP60_9PEZI|nr:related to alpha/beta hydrolase [Ramularia collo-cygni]CZT17011.1 related to alpha/beta hydrolase [Ramularia collo-cygni]
MTSTTKPPGRTDELRETIETSLPKDRQEDPRSPHIKAQGGQPLTVEEVIAHPEYPHVVWNLPANKEGKLDVAAGRGGPLKFAYEVHGHGPSKILWIMGLGGYSRTWQRQIKDFGHVEADKYTCLFCDNRGMGQSDKPLLRYTTSEMAKDIIELLDHLDWKEKRDLHIVGISMGGMIAQELALLIPERICSLNLISTAPRIVRTLPFFENLKNRAQLLMPKTPDNQIAKVKADCYSAEWLAQPDEVEYVVEPFPTNGDRFAAQELRKRTTPGLFTTTGFICQLYAAGFHHKSAKQLKQIGDKVGRNRILVFHGTGDNMVNFVHGKMLLEELGGEESGVTKSFHEGLGHIGPMEMRKQFHDIIAERIEKTEALGRI